MMGRRLLHLLWPALALALWPSISTAASGRLVGIERNPHARAPQWRFVIDGDVEARSFRLASPPRIILDLQGAELALGGSRLPGDGRWVQRLRYSQFALEPEPTVRIVLDLSEAMPFDIEEEAGALILVLSPPRSTPSTKALAQGGSSPATSPSASSSAGPDSRPAAGEPLSPPGSVATDPATHQGTENPPLLTISYLTASTIYVDAGRNEGLAPGDELEVFRSGQSVGRVRVTESSLHRCACTLLESEEALRIGDEVRLAQAGGERILRSESLRTGAGRRSSGENWFRERGMRGRVGARFLSVQDRGIGGAGFHQPALDARLEGTDVGGRPLDFSVDVRTRRTYRNTTADGSTTEGRSRVYRANATFKSFDSHLLFTVGRQYSPELSSLSIFDGAAATLRTTRLSAGILSGTQPDLDSFGFSTEIREHAAFVQWLAAPGSATRWTFTLGAVGSYTMGEINREYLALQSTWANDRASIYFSQDVDYNRGWRRDAEGQTFSWNNTYASLRYKTAENTTTSLGFDNRRNIRLYRDTLSPEVEFDDTFRRGVWSGVDHRFGRKYRLGLRVKRATGGSAGDANTYTLNASARLAVVIRARTTWFTNDLVQGWIHSLSVGTQILDQVRMEVGGGIRDENAQTPGGSDDRLTWTSVMVDYALGRSWYASLSYDRSNSDTNPNDQYYSMLSYRF